MHLKIDHREHDRSESATEYYQQQGLTVETVELPVGDYLFTDGKDSVVFEYKTIPDYISSINDGRLWNEAINQAENYNYHFIIIHGDLYQRTKELIKSRDYIPMTIQQYIGSISSLNRYTTVIQCYNSVIEEAYFTMMKQAEKCLSNRPIVKKFERKDKNPAFNYLAYCVYGISGKKAQSIVNQLDLHTLEDLLYLDEDKLTRIDGIGEKLAERIIGTIESETYD
jgi:DNA excision repair protein ERCC-4